MESLREKTLLLVKPDAVRRGLVGRILNRIEESGLAIVGLAMRDVDDKFGAGHYATPDAQLRQMGEKMLAGYTEAGLDVEREFGTQDPISLGRLIFEWNIAYLTSGPVAAVAIDGFHAVRKVRALCGPTMPVSAPPGTIRGDFSSVSSMVAGPQRAAVRNLVHASDNAVDPKEPQRELDYWFGEDGLVPYEPVSWTALT